MGNFKIERYELNLTDLKPIEDSVDSAEKLLKDIDRESLDTYCGKTFETDDEGLKTLLELNQMHTEFNAELKKIEEPLKKIFDQCDSYLDPVDELIDTFTYSYDNPGSPNKLKIGFIALLTVGLFLFLGSIGALSGEIDFAGILSVYGIGSLVFFLSGVFVLSKYKTKHKTYRKFYDEELPAMKKKLTKDWLDHFDRASREAKRQFQIFSSSPYNQPLFYKTNLEKIVAELTRKRESYKEYSRFTDNLEILIDCLQAVSDKRARILSEAERVVENDHQMEETAFTQAELDENQRQESENAPRYAANQVAANETRLNNIDKSKRAKEMQALSSAMMTARRRH